MKMKTIIAVAALACASVASASTNSAENADKGHSLVLAVREMAKDSALAESDAFRAAPRTWTAPRRPAASGSPTAASRGAVR